MSWNAQTALGAGIGLLPVLVFLVTLLLMDSYKLVRLRTVALVIGLGMLSAWAAFLANRGLIGAFAADLGIYARTLGPAVEELIKGAVVLWLVRTHRIGFLVDAAILGFAVGAGFAVVENLYYLQQLAGAHVGVWIVRGFGTALLHGGVQAIFAVWMLSLAERRGLGPASVLPPLLAAIVVHAGFNQFVLPPLWQTVALLLVLPALAMLVFARSESALQGWLGTGFDADRDLLALLDSGDFPESPHGQYLFALRERFDGAVVADLLCYLRLHVELALRAKGFLMMREAGIEPTLDDATRESFEEMRYLERAAGPTALRALRPLLQVSRRDLWQMYMLGK